MTNQSPIVLFVYNRPLHTEQTLTALSNNLLADQSTLYIFADGPKENASEESLTKIRNTREVIRRAQWCKEVHIIESDENKGLADSIVQGVTKIVNKHGKVIVLEDDIVTSIGFLKYMNDALNIYEEEKRVMHISGFMYPNNKNLPETFFFNVPLCWGWATWKRAWDHFRDDVNELIKFADKNDNWAEINRFGGDFLGSQLKENKSGKLRTWFIKWHVSVLMNQGYTLYPGKSLVNNIGFDNSGVHNGFSNKYEQDSLANRVLVKPLILRENRDAKRIIVSFYGNLYSEDLSLKKKIWLKIRNSIFKFIPFSIKLREIAKQFIKRYKSQMQE